MAAPGPTLHECHACGLRQLVPPLPLGTRARCRRCRTVLRSRRADSMQHALALALAALALLAITASATLMTVETAGIVHDADLIAGPAELVLHGMPSLAVAVVFTSLVAPAAKLLGTVYVLLALRMPYPPRHVRWVFRVVRGLTPWSMAEVLLVGAFVAYVKLQVLVTLSVGPALLALVGLAFTMFWLDAALDADDVWDAIVRKGLGTAPAAQGPGTIACHSCGLLSRPSGARPRCPRCGAALHARKPNSVARTWAFVLGAAILYIPANYYPVLTVVQLGASAPSTILGGVIELIQARDWPLAAIVFLASLAIPILKLAALAAMLVATELHAARWLRERTTLFAITEFIGRWSMIDIFMESLLGALVQFGALVTIAPGIGAVSFCAVVILTMFAAESFDPRLMWDAARVAEPGRGTSA